jgi:hypothetical protein
MSGIDAHQSSIAVWFKFRGKRCREYLGLANNRTNRVLARKIAREIQAEIIAGTFDYALRFPSSKKLKEFSIRPSSQTLAEFAKDRFLVERKINVEASTLAYYESLIRNYVYKSSLARPILHATTLSGYTARFSNSPFGAVLSKGTRWRRSRSSRAEALRLNRLAKMKFGRS